jgi:hypothetical protein
MFVSGNKWGVMLLLALISCPSMADKLKPFSSDGCSGFPDGTLSQKKLWLDCCTTHDLAYWKGGTYENRLQADKDLKYCVAQAGEKEIALLMLAGVRVGGSPYLPTTFRWGYGWEYPRLYGELSAQELQQVEKMTDQSDVPEEAGATGKNE